MTTRVMVLKSRQTGVSTVQQTLKLLQARMEESGLSHREHEWLRQSIIQLGWTIGLRMKYNGALRRWSVREVRGEDGTDDAGAGDPATDTGG